MSEQKNIAINFKKHQFLTTAVLNPHHDTPTSQ